MTDMPKTMLAAILVAQGEPLVLDRVELPETLECGQVLVRVLYSGICGSQLGEIDGVKGPDPWLPHLLGHEGSAEVLACGPGVRHVAPGDFAVMHWMEGNGIQSAPPSYRWRGKRLNAGMVTTFNEYAVVSENRLTKIDPDLDMSLMPLLGCAVTTGLGVAHNKARLAPGESLAVFGAGGVGLNVIQGAALASAYPIVAVDLHQPRLELARRLGASHLVNGAETEPEAAIREIFEREGVDGANVVVDNTGRPELIEAAYRLTGPRGRVILVGVPKAGDNVSIHTLPLHFGKVLTGTKGGETSPGEDIPRYLRLARAGLLDLGALVTERRPLAEINAAIARMRSGEAVGRIILEVAP